MYDERVDLCAYIQLEVERKCLSECQNLLSSTLEVSSRVPESPFDPRNCPHLQGKALNGKVRSGTGAPMDPYVYFQNGKMVIYNYIKFVTEIYSLRFFFHLGRLKIELFNEKKNGTFLIYTEFCFTLK